MTNGKIWLVVKPTVGVPVFLAAVAISSFAVHYALLKNTSWLSNYYDGVSMSAPVAAPAVAG
jgi:light-harvesting protein B-800-850 alpha chain